MKKYIETKIRGRVSAKWDDFETLAWIFYYDNFLAVLQNQLLYLDSALRSETIWNWTRLEPKLRRDLFHALQKDKTWVNSGFLITDN